MTTDKPLCATCGRDPARMNSAVAECSHVECPHRERAWSGGTGYPKWSQAPKTTEPLDPLFDKVEV